MKRKEKGYLIDTSTISVLLDSRNNAYAATVAAIKAIPSDCTQWLCPITLGEITFGVEYFDLQRGSEASELRSMLAKALSYPLQKMSRHTGRFYGELKGKLADKAYDLKGKKVRKIEEWIDVIDMKPFGISENDLWIAAIALEHELTLVSNDGDFTRLHECWPSLEVIVIGPKGVVVSRPQEA